MRYLEDNKVISKSQFGFRQGKSCVTNLSFYTRVIEGIENRDGWVDAVYLDIKKAFDTVPHKRLLWKLKHIGGLRGKLLEWIQNYLKDRNENCDQGRNFELEESNKWSTTGVSHSTHHVPGICK